MYFLTRVLLRLAFCHIFVGSFFSSHFVVRRRQIYALKLFWGIFHKEKFFANLELLSKRERIQEYGNFWAKTEEDGMRTAVSSLWRGWITPPPPVNSIKRYPLNINLTYIYSQMRYSEFWITRKNISPLPATQELWNTIKRILILYRTYIFSFLLAFSNLTI